MIHYEKIRTIRDLLEQRAEHNPSKVAIHFEMEGPSFTYQELNLKVNQVANVFREMGINKNSHVAVMLPNCPEFPLTWLALAKIGAIMIPVNYRYKSQDMEYILNDSEAILLVTHAEVTPILKNVIPKCSKLKQIITVGEGGEDFCMGFAELIEKAPVEIQSARLRSDDVVNIQYTSGTTGFPKGCILTHEYWLILGRTAFEGISEEDIFLSAQPFYYMDPQWHLIMTLTKGCTMVLAERYSPSRYITLAAAYGATCSLAPRAILIYKQPESNIDNAHNLKRVNIYGFPTHLHRAFEKRFNLTAREAYGMTEIGSCMRMPMADSHMIGSGSVGKLVPNREVRIVDKNFVDVPVGMVGELLVKGPGLFKGYYRKPEETNEAFHGEWFRTGDLFRKDLNGYFYIVGRIRDSVRRHGENISASEVEDVIKSHPKVFDAAVVPVPDELSGEEVKAYIIPSPGLNQNDIPPEELINFCLDRLAKFKVPRFIEYRKTMPRTPSQRVEKYKLLAEKRNLVSGCYDVREKRWYE